MLRLLSWNVGHHQPWGDLDGVDVALLQELRPPPAEWAGRLVPSPTDGWSTAGVESRDFRTAIARVSDAVALSARPMGEISTADPTVLAVSRPGTLTAAEVLRGQETVLTAVSMYAAWESTEFERKFIYADASAHRIISDLARWSATGTDTGS